MWVTGNTVGDLLDAVAGAGMTWNNCLYDTDGGIFENDHADKQLPINALPVDRIVFTTYDELKRYKTSECFAAGVGVVISALPDFNFACFPNPFCNNLMFYYFSAPGNAAVGSGSGASSAIAQTAPFLVVNDSCSQLGSHVMLLLPVRRQQNQNLT